MPRKADLTREGWMVVNRYSEKEMQDFYQEYELLLSERRQREEKWMAHSGGKKPDGMRAKKNEENADDDWP